MRTQVAMASPGVLWLVIGQSGHAYYALVVQQRPALISIT